MRMYHHALRMRWPRRAGRARRRAAGAGGDAAAVAAARARSSSGVERARARAPAATTREREHRARPARRRAGRSRASKATGTPINIGTIDTKQPGTDFSDGPNMINAYFTCVNANGGVNGHPLKLFVEYDQTQPAQIAAAAQAADPDRPRGRDRRRVRPARVHDRPELLEAARHLRDGRRASLPSAGRPRTAPRSTWVRATAPTEPCSTGSPSTRRRSCSSSPTSRAPATSPPARRRWPKAAHVPITELTENVPINDANSVALNLVNKAGSNGWVVLNFTPPEALVILQAAQKLGLEDRVKGWGCSTPCNTDFLAKALGPKWNHKLFVNAELTIRRRPQRPGDAALQGDPRPVRPGRRRRPRLVQPDGLPAREVLRRARSTRSRLRTRSRASTRRSRASRTRRPSCSASRGCTATTRCTSPTTPTSPRRRTTGRW